MKMNVLLFAAVFTCIGCGHDATARQKGSSEPARASSKHDPCSLVTKEEMTQAIGVPITEMKPDGSRCSYLPQNPGDGSGTITTTASREDTMAMFAAMKTGDQMTGTHPDGPAAVPTLGDESVYAMYALNVRKGDASFSIQLTLPNLLMKDLHEPGGPKKFDADLLQIETALAQKALPRL
ncbi:MAG TPA: hypothetical protein VK525_09860 [Candidatus Saccharimonadales bacterium]|nr:hypothetical protein [Candidatus Saccharimonadales bacterium]